VIPPTALLLLDTNVLVHLVRGDDVGIRIADQYKLRERVEKPLISIITVGEMKALTMKLGWGEKKREILDKLLQELVIVHLNQGNIIEKYSEIDYYSEKMVKPAHPMGQNDMWIAATASALDAYLLTTDNDFDHLVPDYLNRIKIELQA
jgi:predicted nucleic acid-binding protein